MRDWKEISSLRNGGRACSGVRFRETIEELAMYMFTIGRNTHDTIDEIKYGGRLVILNDGSRWEVDDGDEDTSEFWNSFDEVAVIDGKMYNLSDCESVDVTEDS